MTAMVMPRAPMFKPNQFVYYERGIARVCWHDDNPDYGFCYYLVLDSGYWTGGLVEEYRLKLVADPGKRCLDGTAETGPTCFGLLDEAGRCGHHSCRSYDYHYVKPEALMARLNAAAAAQVG